MDKRILAIYDSEETYACRLMDFFSNKDKFPFRIHVFTRKDKFLAFVEKEEIECLLLSENAYQNKIEELKIPHIIILSESGVNLNKALHHIDKYQSCEAILKEVLAYYTENAGEVTEFAAVSALKKMKIIGIYTPTGRCLQTTFSLTLGQMLSRRHKTLYLNFEPYSGFGRMLNREFKSDISDLAYYFSCAREKLFFYLESMVENMNGLDFVPPAAVYHSLAGIRGSGWIELFREIEKITEYEYLILDLSDCLVDLWEVLKNCDHIYTIIKEDPLALAKVEQYEKALESMEYGEIANRTRKWNLPNFRQLPLRFEELTYGELAAFIKKEVFPGLLEESDSHEG